MQEGTIQSQRKIVALKLDEEAELKKIAWPQTQEAIRTWPDVFRRGSSVGGILRDGLSEQAGRLRRRDLPPNRE